jgi:hypothetical protein
MDRRIGKGGAEAKAGRSSFGDSSRSGSGSSSSGPIQEVGTWGILYEHRHQLQRPWIQGWLGEIRLRQSLLRPRWWESSRSTIPSDAVTKIPATLPTHPPIQIQGLFSITKRKFAEASSEANPGHLPPSSQHRAVSIEGRMHAFRTISPTDPSASLLWCIEFKNMPIKQGFFARSPCSLCDCMGYFLHFIFGHFMENGVSMVSR